MKTVELGSLALAFLPVLVVLAIYFYWQLDYKKAGYALSRMLLQLLTAGYFLAYLFDTKLPWIVLTVLLLMVLVSSWISLNTVSDKRRGLYGKALTAIAIGGGVTLLMISQTVLSIDPWYAPQYLIPLGGMIFANAMTSISLCAERFFSEIDRGAEFISARSAAFNASLIPVINSLFAVGLVSLPGMMTGQILSGVSPLIAARYQIMVMCMVFAASGMTSAIFLFSLKKTHINLPR